MNIDTTSLSLPVGPVKVKNYFYTAEEVKSHLNNLILLCKSGILAQIEAKIVLNHQEFEIDWFNSHSYQVRYYGHLFNLI